jgi:hypothetical protein
MASLLLGTVPQDSTENRRERGWILILSLPDSDCPTHARIGLYSGPSPHDEGGSREASFWLTHRPTTYELVDGKYIGTQAAAGWFDRFCVEIGCGWFIPMARRLARGEDVPVSEIKATYAAHHGGRTMLEGNFQDFFGLGLR